VELFYPLVLCKREESAHGVVSLLGARSAAPSRFTVYGLTRKAEAETIRAVVVVVSASFLCLSRERASQRVGQKIPRKCYQVQAHDGIGCLHTGNEVPANALTIKDASWFRLSGFSLRF